MWRRAALVLALAAAWRPLPAVRRPRSAGRRSAAPVVEELSAAAPLEPPATVFGPPILAPRPRPAPVTEEEEDAARRPVEPAPGKARPTNGSGWYTFGFQRDAAASPALDPDFDVLRFLGVDDSPVRVYEPKQTNNVVAELAGFTLPLLVVWLASPLLSLVDTAAVGASRATAELAVLGPACAACDNAAFLCTFLGVVTTGGVAKAVASGDEDGARTCSGAATVAGLTVGAALTIAALSPLGPAALGALLPRATPGFSAAVAYGRIRALAFAPAILIIVLQSTALARRDVKAPLKAAGAAAALNVVGDALLVPKFGLAGAAAATAAAQFAALYSIVKDAQKGAYLPVEAKAWVKAAGAPVRAIFARGAPVVAALAAKTSVLLALSYAAARAAAKREALAELAAHQILVGLYFVFAPVGDALSQTVQTFLPRSIVADRLDDVRKPAPSTRALGPASRAVVKGSVAAAVALGGLDALCAYALPALRPGLFSADPAVAAALSATAPYLGLALLVHGLSSAAEGTMLANRDAKVLGGLYAADAAAAVAAFAAVAARAGPLSAVWRVFLGYQVARCAQFSLRVASTAFRRRP